MTRAETLFLIELARRAPKLSTEQIMLDDLVNRIGDQWQADDAARESTTTSQSST